MKRDGTIESEEDKKILAEIIERATNCFGCGVCLGQCEADAIELKGNKAHINENCTGCLICHEHCPVVRYG